MTKSKATPTKSLPPAQREQQNLEWKESWRDEYLRWICGFANADGGTLVIGRNYQGQAVGLPNASKLLEDIPNKVRDVLGIMVAVNLMLIEGKELLEIVVEAYPSPVSYKGEYHYRSGSTKQELKGAALSHFLLKKQGLHWDSLAVPGLKVAALDKLALKTFREQALLSKRLPAESRKESVSLLLERLHLLVDDVCKRATTLLFHAEPSRWFTGAWVKIGFFDTNVDLRYQDEINGPVFLQVEKTIEVLQAKYLKALISYQGLQRVETWPVPMEALREAVLNAVVHKDYTRGAPIQISVYADKLMIWNPARLPPELTLERLLAKHSSDPFNPDMANTFFRSGQIESWGRGIERMMQSCLEAGMAEPVLKVEPTGVWVIFEFLPERSTASTEASKNVAAEMAAELAVKATVEMAVKASLKFRSKNPAVLLPLFESRPEASLSELASVLGMSLRTLERDAAKLVEAGKLRFVGPKKGGRWEVL
jgi:ATP-dependent DNA helicase RecG